MTVHAPRILLLMTTETYKAGAFLAAAGRLGIDVVVGTQRRQATAVLNPGGHLTLDFGRPQRAVERIAAAARRNPLDAVVATDDEGVVLAARACEALGLPYSPPPAVVAARSKLATREALRRAGLPAPWFEGFRLNGDPAVASRRVPYPCVLKPLDLAASRGVIRADDPAGFAAAWRRLQTLLAPAGDREILVEGFIPGLEVALEGILTGGRLRTLAIFDKPDPLDGPYFEETIYVTPSRHPRAVQRRLTEAAAGAVSALGLTEGPVHAELRCDPADGADNPAGRAWVLEVAPRSIGGLCSRALRFAESASGAPVSLEELILRHALGRDVSHLERERPASGVMMIPIPRAGVLRRVDGCDGAARVDGIEEVRITAVRGQPVAPPPEGWRYLGFLFARAATPARVEEALRAGHAKLRVEITEPDTPGVTS